MKTELQTPKTKSNPAVRKLPARDAWERIWQKHWRKVGMPGYELPPSDERDFLATARTPDKERARLNRINDEFARAFKTFYNVGPAVTVFGSARFKETHPYYKLARAVGGELAKAGFATLTGGGPTPCAGREATATIPGLRLPAMRDVIEL